MMTRDAYVANAGKRCPACTGFTDESEGLRFSGPVLLVDRKCPCGARWTEIFELRDYEMTKGGR